MQPLVSAQVHPLDLGAAVSAPAVPMDVLVSLVLLTCLDLVPPSNTHV